MSAADWQALWLTLQLASCTTLVLMVIGTPLAWWLSQSRARISSAVEAIVALPLILPPTVLGFYLLIAFAPDAWPAKLWLAGTGQTLAFSFTGLVIASVIYSLPFVVQPLQSAFTQLDQGLLEAAGTIGANKLDRFFSITMPLCRRSFIAAMVLGFAHTVGEFGVVLMIGGNIPGETQVLSIALYDRVETLDYASAHWLAGGLLLFSFLVLLMVYSRGKQPLRM